MKKSTLTFWKNTGSKLLKISDDFLDLTIPIAVNMGIKKVCKIVDCTLHEMYKNTVKNSLITLFLNVAGFLFLFFNFFGAVISKYISASLFIVALILFIVRFVKYLVHYGKISLQIFISIICNISVRYGIENYVYTRFPAIALVYAGLDIASKRLPALKKIPTIDKTVGLFIQLFWKKLAAYVLILAAYSILINVFAKPMLLEMAGLKCYEIYLYPIYHIISIIKLNLQ